MPGDFIPYSDVNNAAFIQIFQQDLTSNSTVTITAVNVNVWNKAGEDFAYCNPELMPASGYYVPWSSTTYNEGAIVDEGPLDVIERFGQTVLTLQELTRRPCYNYTLSSSSDASSSFTMPFCGMTPQYPGGTSGSAQGVGLLGCSWTYFHWIARSYLTFLGGFRHRIITNPNSRMTQVGLGRSTVGVISTSTFYADLIYPTPPLISFFRGEEYTDNVVFGEQEVTVPFKLPYLACDTRFVTGTITTASYTDTIVYPIYIYQEPVTVFVSGADDLTLGAYWGPPVFMDTRTS